MIFKDNIKSILKMSFKTFGDILDVIDCHLLKDTTLEGLLEMREFTLAENTRYVQKVEENMKKKKRSRKKFNAALDAGKQFEKRLLKEKSFLRDNTIADARDVDLVCRNTNIHIEAKAEIVPLFAKKLLTSDFRKKTIMFEMQNINRPGSMLRALLKDAKALVFYYIYEYKYASHSKRMRSYEQARKKALPVEEFDNPPNGHRILGFKILPLAKYLVRMYDSGIAKFQQVDGRMFLFVPYSEILKQNFVIEYEIFDEEWMRRYSNA
jgi:hypothetical protein